VGGLVGRLNNTSGENAAFQNSFAAFKMTGDTEVGGLLGSASNLHTFSGVYWDSELSGVYVASGVGSTTSAIARNTSEMMTKSTFWMFDFDSLWKIADGFNYPSLRAHVISGIELTAPLYVQGYPAAGVNRLAWHISVMADLYIVLRATTNNYSHAEAIAISFSNTHDDFMVSPNETYYYWIVAADIAENTSNPVGPASVTTTGLLSPPTLGSGTIKAVAGNWEYFDFSLGAASTSYTDGAFVGDVRGTSNEGVNFGNENAPNIEGRRIHFVGYGSLADVRHVPFRVDAQPWRNVSWELGYLPLQVGQVWAVFTSEKNYTVMEVSQVPDEHGSEFSFNYMYLGGGSPAFVNMGGTPKAVVYVSGDSQAGDQESDLAEPFVVRILDENGDGLPGVIVEFKLVDSPSGEIHWGAIQRTRVISDANGFAASTLKTGNQNGVYTTWAYTSHIPDAVEFIAFVGALSTDVDINRPEQIQLAQNYPNPFNPTTKIRYELPIGSDVSLKVYDMLGREVATLVSGIQASGSHEVNLDASSLSSGMYLYKLEAAG
jgi:hypothetical protein